jgi:sugar/nucleoside kinase (ribokinase family)
VLLTAVGEVMVDVVAASPGEPVAHAPVSLRAGGTPVNAAFAAAALGARACVVGRVGDDAPAALVRDALSRVGIATELAVDPTLPTGCFVQLGESIVAARGANAALEPRDVAAAAGADAVLVSGYVLLQQGTQAAGEAVLALEAGWIGADAGAAHLIAGLGPGEAGARLGPARALFLNAGEAAALTGLDPEAAARRLAARHEVVVVKLGAAGAVAASNEGLIRAAAPFAADGGVVVGAGDALDAGVLVGLARGLDLESALALGCEAAALARR